MAVAVKPEVVLNKVNPADALKNRFSLHSIFPLEYKPISFVAEFYYLSSQPFL